MVEGEHQTFSIFGQSLLCLVVVVVLSSFKTNFQTGIFHQVERGTKVRVL